MDKLHAAMVLAPLAVTSCLPQQGQPQTGIEATKAYESDLATALAGTLAAVVTASDTAIESTSTVALSPTPTPGIGSTYVRAADEQTMLFVPAGKFTMGINDGAAGEGPAHQVFLDGCWIDRTEVTNGQYSRCVTAGECKKKSSVGEAEGPVVSVPWAEAQAYCSWTGARLPTEAEWEKAARGTDARTYPWGDALDKARYTPMGWDNTVEAVGSYPSGASPYGVLDMAGSAFEWLADWYSPPYYSNSPASNPPGPKSGEQHVSRGAGGSGVHPINVVLLGRQSARLFGMQPATTAAAAPGRPGSTIHTPVFAAPAARCLELRSSEGDKRQ